MVVSAGGPLVGVRVRFELLLPCGSIGVLDGWWLVMGCPRSEVMRLEPFGIEGCELVRSGHSNVTLFQNVTLQSFSHTNPNVTLYENT